MAPFGDPCSTQRNCRYADFSGTASLYGQAFFIPKALGVRGVVNLCDEYGGPQACEAVGSGAVCLSPYDCRLIRQGPVREASYDRMEITQLRLPTVDHYEPSLEDLLKAQFQGTEGPGKDRTLDRGLRSCRIRPSSLLRSSDSVDTKFMFTAKAAAQG